MAKLSQSGFHRLSPFFSGVTVFSDQAITLGLSSSCLDVLRSDKTPFILIPRSIAVKWNVIIEQAREPPEPAVRPSIADVLSRDPAAGRQAWYEVTVRICLGNVHW